MSITKKQLPIILHLNEDPLMSLQDLADRLGVTWVTAKKRYEELREQGILIFHLY